MEPKLKKNQILHGAKQILYGDRNKEILRGDDDVWGLRRISTIPIHQSCIG